MVPLYGGSYNPTWYQYTSQLLQKEAVGNLIIPAFRKNHGGLDFSKITTADKMSLSIVNPKPTYQVGENISIKITARDKSAHQRLHGGDFLLAKLYTDYPVKSCTPGKVTDYKNGSYVAQFLLSLPGNFSVSVKLIQPSEAVHILRRIHDSFLEGRVTYCNFVDTIVNISEWTECSFSRKIDHSLSSHCDFSRPILNATWSCTKPKRSISCKFIKECKRNETATIELQKKMVSAQEIQLLNSTRVYMDILNNISITVKEKDILQEDLPLCSPRLLEKGTDGYWYNGKWNLLRCRLNEYLPTLSTYKCLRHKTFFIVGDSTARQYDAFLKKLVQDINVQLPDAIREWEKIHKSINIKFHFHTFPRNTRTPLQMSDIKYTADLIDSIVGGPDVVIILSLWAHYSAVPSETFLSRVYGIRHAIERLHSRSPGTKVVWRTGNTRKHMTVAHVIENGNWVAYQNLLGARQILQGLDIFFMDVWDMSVCEDVYRIHPEPNVIKNHIDLILNYVCEEPKKAV